MTAPFPTIVNEPWRARAACAGNPRPELWDATVAGETADEREWRHHQAKAVCARCPVAFECAQAIDWTWDAGVRAGTLLPETRAVIRRPPGEQPINHGTEGGERVHRRRGEKPCHACRNAALRADAERRARRGA